MNYNKMNKYNWKGYDFIGTVPEFAEKFGYCKTPTFVNAVKRVPRHKYNCMDAVEQRAYEEKRKRAKRAYCIYMNEEMTDSYIITKEEYMATNHSCSRIVTGYCHITSSETAMMKSLSNPPW